MSHTNERQKQTETPRTHAAIAERQAAIWKGNTMPSFSSVSADFARQLEMELVKVREEFDQLRQARAENERLKRDGERLDWLNWNPWPDDDAWTDFWFQNRLTSAMEIRDAIDSAMAEGGQDLLTNAQQENLT